ncbi:MAG: dihydrofolate reductase [Clostridiales bacterium]|nr:dihydrofolate reductase [Clostridiales bacterium]
MAHILINYGVPREGFDKVLAGHTLHIPAPGTLFSEGELDAILPQAEAVVACTAFPAGMIEKAGKLRLICAYGAGYDSIDVVAATKAGVMVCNIPDTVTDATAEVAISHMLGLARRMPFFDKAVRQEGSQKFFRMGENMGTTLKGTTLGIVGMGRIGGKVADFGRLMGMKVLYHSRNPKPERDALGDIRVSLEELMAQADFVSLHCPSTPETRGLINREMIALMKPTAFLINTARGPVIDEAALLDALNRRSIAGAGLDVFPDEPNVNPALWPLDNVILTPHIGSNTAGTRYDMAAEASRQILRVFSGQKPENLING